MINIQVDEPFDQAINLAELEEAAARALVYTGTSDQAGLTIVVGGDAQIQDLNRQFKGSDHPTDVLSFPSGEVDPDDGQVYLGDIIVSFPQALRQAKEGGHPVGAELRLLVVHGVLHLLGFDHGDPEAREVMWKYQAEILRQVGNTITGPTIET
jgi:probable rRNA maturation factor